MNRTRLGEEIDKDLQSAVSQKVIYLEGMTDVSPFFGLLGVTEPPRGLHQGVLVKGLAAEKKSRGSGGSGVKARTDYSIENKYNGIYGFIDGDGRSLSRLVPEFDFPHSGPLYSWKAYCIENLLAQTGWPAAWGDEPDWPVTFLDYGPYVALNRVHAELQEAVVAVDVARRMNPQPDEPLRTADQIIQRLAQEKHRLVKFNDIETEFQNALDVFRAAVSQSVDEAHALLNGKWLVEHLALVRVRALRGSTSKDALRTEWSEHARSTGGHPDVRSVWERITGQPP